MEESEPMPEPSNPRGEALYGAIVGALYVLAVGVQVFIVMDELTDGGLSSDLLERWRRLTARWRERRLIDAQVKAEAPWVVFEAAEAAREAAGGDV